MKNAIEFFANGFVVISREVRAEWLEFIRRRGIVAHGGALLDDGKQVFYTEAKRDIRELCVELLNRRGVDVPREKIGAFAQAFRANGGAYTAAGQWFYID